MSYLSTPSSSANVPILTTANYSLWAPAMEDYLRARGMWFWIHADTPDRVSDPKGHRKYLESRDQAVGEIRRHIAPELRSVALNSTDPESILEAIKTTYGASSFATRHNALQALLAIRQESAESVAVFIAHAREGLRFLQSTRPPSAPIPTPVPGATPLYSLQDSDKELLISVLLNGTRYSTLTTSLLALSELTVQQVEDALKNEEAHRVGAAAAAAAAATPAVTAVSGYTCTFCGKGGHPVERCWKFEEYSKKAKEDVSKESGTSKNRRPKCKGKANATQENSTSESAGAASIRLSSSPSTLPDTWNADTGATSHMTPRREWFKSYTPCSVPIRVANGQVVYAAGRGTVEFAPVKDGRNLRPVLFSEVLHVPSLNQNLLSVLTLTVKHAFDVLIKASTITFTKDSIPRFYASVGADRVALLSGSTVVQAASSMQLSGYELWHRRFGHISASRLKSLVELEMVSNLSLPSVPSSTPICPSCMDGKQTRDPFPHSTSRRSTPLQLVHSDLHGPLPPTANGFKYWISFTDDASRYHRCWLLHKKSEAFDAFKHYKAWAEKQTGKALKSLRDDKGGEYMSNEWENFMLEHGIERQHTARATPQQNGVAERTNRILDEGVASLLSDSHFPARFWGEALSCFLHTLNLSPSAAVSGKTPYEAFYGRKPSVAHLRVFGCRAYAHVQKDKRHSFQPKSRKCIFLGYPVDYKGWKCWDPSTNEVFISRDVRFVETEMPGAELGLSGPRYEPLSGVQPGSVGEPAGTVPATSSLPFVPPVEPASTPPDDDDSDSGSEPDIDDADFVPPVPPSPAFVPPAMPDSPSRSRSASVTRDNVSHPDFPPSPSASSPLLKLGL